MEIRKIPDKFLVAFSFAGEQRDLVRSIAEAVEERLGRGKVFYDEWFEHYIAGADADIRLQDIYEQKAELIIVSVSANYGGKPWPLAEHEVIRSLNMQWRTSGDKKDAFRILPLRTGEGDVKGIPFTTISPDVRKRPVAQTVELIANRLGLIRPDVRSTPGTPSNAPAAAPRTLRELATQERRELEDLLTGSPWFVADTNRNDVVEYLLLDERSFAPLERHSDVESEAFALVRKCSKIQRGWDALVEALVQSQAPAELIEGLTGKLQDFFQRPIRWSELGELKKLLHATAVDDVDADAAFAAAAPLVATLDLSGADGRHFVRYLECLAPLPHAPPANAPLLTFLELCASKLAAPALAAPLADWKSAVAGPQRLNLDLTEIRRLQQRQPAQTFAAAGTAQSGPAQRLPVLLQVKFGPKEGAHSSDLYEVMAWLWLDGKMVEINLEDLKTVKSLPLDGLAQEKFKPILLELIQRAMKQTRRTLRVEIIAPYELLEDEIDCWEIKVGVEDEPLGERVSLVLRSFERHYDYDGTYAPAFPRWEEKWGQLCSPLTTPRAYWAESATCYDDLKGLYGQLKPDALVFVGCVLPARDQPGSFRFREALARIVSAGLPLVVWLRGYQGDGAAARDHLQTMLLNEGHETWPERMRRYRESKPAPLAGEGISLLWDNPGQLPPDSPDFALEDPHNAN